MFRSGMKESLGNEIKIEDFDAEIIEGMLEFIYFRKISLTNARALLRCSHLFQLPYFDICEAKGEEAPILDNLKSHFCKCLDIVKTQMKKGQERVTNLTDFQSLYNHMVNNYSCS